MGRAGHSLRPGWQFQQDGLASGLGGLPACQGLQRGQQQAPVAGDMLIRSSPAQGPLKPYGVCPVELSFVGAIGSRFPREPILIS